MIYALEALDSCLPDISGLLESHHREVGERFDLDPDIQTYRALETSLRIYTARREGLLIGYATFIVCATNLHHKGLRSAANDSLYIMPSCRGFTGSLLMAYAEAQLKAEGIKVVTIHVPKVNDWTPLAIKWGYEVIETHVRKVL